MEVIALDSIFFDKKSPARLDTLIDIIDFSRFEEIELEFNDVVYHDISLASLVNLSANNDLVVMFILFDFIENDTSRLRIQLIIKSRDKNKLIHI